MAGGKAFLYQSQFLWGYGYEPSFVQVADSFLECLLAYLECALDVLCVALVAQWAHAIVVAQIFEKGLCEVGCQLTACWLECDVYFPVGSDIVDISRHAVASGDMLEDLSLID